MRRTLGGGRDPWKGHGTREAGPVGGRSSPPAHRLAYYLDRPPPRLRAVTHGRGEDVRTRAGPGSTEQTHRRLAGVPCGAARDRGRGWLRDGVGRAGPPAGG